MKNRVYSVQTNITVRANRQAVWALLAQFDDVHTWAPGVLKSHGIGQSKLGVGHGRHCELKGFGGIDETITQWLPNEKLVYSVSDVGPLKNGSSRWELRQLNEQQTELAISLSFELRFGVLGRLMFHLMMKPKLQASLDGAAAATKKRVESGMVVPVQGMMQPSS